MDLLKKPTLTYTPEEVITPEPSIDTIKVEDVTTNQQELQLRNALEELDNEIFELEVLEKAIKSTPIYPAPISPEYYEVTGLQEVTYDNYLANLDNQTFAGGIIRKVFEDYHCNPDNPRANEGGLLLGIVNDVKNDLIGTLDVMSEEVYSDFYSDLETDTTNETQIAKQDIENSKKIRSSVEEAFVIAKEELQECLIKSLIGIKGRPTGSSNRESVSKKPEDLRKLLKFLKATKAALKYQMVLRSMEWGSMMDLVRNMFIKSALDIALRMTLGLYRRSYNKLVGPLQDYLDIIGNYDTDCEAFIPFKNIMNTTTSHLMKKYEDSIVDILTYKENAGKIKIDPIKKTQEMIRVRNYLPVIDAAIYVIEEYLNGYLPEVDTVKRIMDYASAKKHPLSGMEIDSNIDHDRKAWDKKARDKANRELQDAQVTEKMIGVNSAI